MKIEINTKEDPHEDIRKVIKLLQHIVGDSQEVFTNQPEASSTEVGSAFTNIFGDTSGTPQESSAPSATTTQEEKPETETSESTEDLFAELFSEEEIKKMNQVEIKEEEEVEEKIKLAKDKKYSIEFY